jgi:hypothetical protein
MRLLVVAFLAATAAGCIGPGDAPPTATPTPPSPTAMIPSPEAPAAVYDETIDFSEDVSGGVVHEVDLELPRDARSFTFTVDFTADTPTSTAKDVRIWMVDGMGDTVADCDLGTSAVTSAEGRDCGPTTNNVHDTSYQLRWRGFGNLRAHVLVTAE